MAKVTKPKSTLALSPASSPSQSPKLLTIQLQYLN